MTPPAAFTLLDATLRAGLVTEFERCEPKRLDRFKQHSPNTGIYALFYVEPTGPYVELGERADIQPVYLGKAGASGLQERLSQHMESLMRVGLNPLQFRCRFIEMCTPEDAAAAEALLLRHYKPVWNNLLKGFGNKDQGTTRHTQRRSKWDTLHAGRVWAGHQQPRSETPELLDASVRDYLRETAVPLQGGSSAAAAVSE